MSCVVVTGSPGSGKTTLARMLAESLTFPITNVGELLELHLVERGIRPTSKPEIGPAFIAEFGLLGYTELLTERVAARDIVIDGLRIFDALASLRGVNRLCLVYREASPEETRKLDIYDEELPHFRRHADIVVPWHDNVVQLLPIAQDVNRFFRRAG